MHPFPLTRYKVRGVPRRLRALRAWVLGLAGRYPSASELQGQAWSHKIPVQHALVESRHTTRDIRRACAQALIDAAHQLLKARPEGTKGHRVVAVICLPDMFTSEVCIYLQEAYFLGHTMPASTEHGHASVISGRRLSEAWGLQVPPGMGEMGLMLDYRGHEDPSDWFVGERWYFGELASIVR